MVITRKRLLSAFWFFLALFIEGLIDIYFRPEKISWLTLGYSIPSLPLALYCLYRAVRMKKARFSR